MRPFPVLLMLGVTLIPLAAAHDENVLFHLTLPAGPSAGVATFEIGSPHRLLGIGVGGCGLGDVGALRIATPTGGTLEATMQGLSPCSSGASNLAGEDPTRLAPGTYVGAYGFELMAGGSITIYGAHVG